MTAAQLFAFPQTRSTSDDCYTPRHVFDRLAIRFDMDVASPEGGSPWVPADRYLTMKDDALSVPWAGRVWMNPPYSNVTPWWDKFSSHRNGIALLPMAKSHWVNRVFDEAEGIAIGEDGGEMKFMRPGQKPMRIWFPVFFAAFGDECVEAIGRIGRVRR